MLAECGVGGQGRAAELEDRSILREGPDEGLNCSSKGSGNASLCTSLSGAGDRVWQEALHHPAAPPMRRRQKGREQARPCYS